MTNLDELGGHGPASAHVLLSNDDGVASEGLSTWRDELMKRGCRVSVIAPAVEQSGMARAVSCAGSTHVTRIGGDRRNPVFACDGSPVDCVRVGLLSGLLDPVTVVGAGINHGANLGDNSTYSGTVGAAMEASLLGTPGVAVSQQDDAGDLSLLTRGGFRFELAWFAAAVVELVAQRPPPERQLLSVNLPHHLVDHRADATKPGTFAYPRDWAPAEPLGSNRWRVWPYAKPGEPDPEFDLGPATDLSAIARGVVSLTLLSANWSSDRDGAEASADWLSQLSCHATSELQARDGARV